MTKYIEVPYTTSFGVLFLPFEGLYAEVVSSGVTELLQREYQITVAGPSTMAALLNALQMGFRTLAIQKRSGEVWTILGAVKTEFEKFGAGLQQMQRHLNQTGSDLEELIGPRSRAITRKLESVQQLDPDTATALLGIEGRGGVPMGLSAVIARFKQTASGRPLICGPQLPRKRPSAFKMRAGYVWLLQIHSTSSFLPESAPQGFSMPLPTLRRVRCGILNKLLNSQQHAALPHAHKGVTAMIRIVTDSAADLTAAELSLPGIFVVPLSVTFADGTTQR